MPLEICNGPFSPMINI